MKEQLFIHKRTGNEYVLLTIGKDVKTKVSMAVYVSKTTFETWVTPLSIFNQNFSAKTQGG